MWQEGTKCSSHRWSRGTNFSASDGPGGLNSVRGEGDHLKYDLTKATEFSYPTAMRMEHKYSLVVLFPVNSPSITVYIYH